MCVCVHGNFTILSLFLMNIETILSLNVYICDRTKCGSVRRVNAARKDGAEKALQKMAKKRRKTVVLTLFGT